MNTSKGSAAFMSPSLSDGRRTPRGRSRRRRSRRRTIVGTQSSVGRAGTLLTGLIFDHLVGQTEQAAEEADRRRRTPNTPHPRAIAARGTTPDEKRGDADERQGGGSLRRALSRARATRVSASPRAANPMALVSPGAEQDDHDGDARATAVKASSHRAGTAARRAPSRARPSASSSRMRSTACTPAAAASTPTMTMSAAMSARCQVSDLRVAEALEDRLDLRVVDVRRRDGGDERSEGEPEQRGAAGPRDERRPLQPPGEGERRREGRARPVARPERSGSRLAPSSRRACTTSATADPTTARPPMRGDRPPRSSVKASVCWPQPIGESQLGQAGTRVRSAMSARAERVPGRRAARRRRAPGPRRCRSRRARSR